MPEGHLPEDFARILGVLTLVGAFGWVWVFTRGADWSRRVQDGASWLDWRPLPSDLIPRMFFVACAGLGAGILWQVMWGSVGMHPLWLLMVSMLTFHVPVALVAFWVSRRDRVPVRESIGMHGEDAVGAAALGGMGYVLAWPWVLVASHLTRALFSLWGLEMEAQPLMVQLHAFETLPEIAVLVLFAVLIGPYCEEVIFRGALFPWLSQRVGWVAGLVIHSVLFAWIHGHLASFLPLFTLSVLLGILYMVRKSLMSVFWMHAVFNAMSLAAFFLTGGGVNGE